jgi:hypothetical protein
MHPTLQNAAGHPRAAVTMPGLPRGPPTPQQGPTLPAGPAHRR